MSLGLELTVGLYRATQWNDPRSQVFQPPGTLSEIHHRSSRGRNDLVSTLAMFPPPVCRLGREECLPGKTSEREKAVAQTRTVSVGT